jgi:2-oxoglutarate dehydrogenase E2 component (dihydrolipoamide succinyltransferase)
MAMNVAVPNLGDSVAEATLLRWHKSDGDLVKADEPLCELETDKANVDVPSPAAGVLKRIKRDGETVKIGEVIASVDPDGKPTPASAAVTSAAAPSKPAPSEPTRVAPSPPANEPPTSPPPSGAPEIGHSPAVLRLLEEHHLDASKIPATGPGGRLTKEDVINYLETSAAPPPVVEAKPSIGDRQLTLPTHVAGGVRREPMSKIRKRIAENLVRAQQTAAILTTFNEVDLSAVMDLRSKYKDAFEKANGVGLGFMSFFVRACCLALKEFPRVNGQIDGDDVLLFDYVNMGVAVSTDRGLAVPILRNADQMSFATIESEIKRVATAVREGKLGVQELSGGTFTITNGGVFGSLLSTPIINPPQSAILGMHKIEQRPVAVNGQVVIRPMMYLALSYDHRIIDGKESVSFLVRVKEYLEDPARMVLGI